MTPLTPEELEGALRDLQGWYVEAGQLTLRRELPSFAAAIAFVQDVARIAEELDHHPDIDVRWRTVKLAVCTHAAAGALTSRDIALARAIDRLGR